MFIKRDGIRVTVAFVTKIFFYRLNLLAAFSFAALLISRDLDLNTTLVNATCSGLSRHCHEVMYSVLDRDPLDEVSI